MNPYFEQKILAADPIELVRLLYQRAISSVREAREHLRNGRIAQRSKAITEAYEVLRELLSSLRPEAAPKIAIRLGGLYCYIQQRLLDANLQQADAPLTEVLGLLATLAGAWDQIAGGEMPREEKTDSWPSGGWSGPRATESGVALEA